MIRLFICSGTQMIPSRPAYAQFVGMPEQARRDYADSRMYIHRKKKGEAAG